MFGPLTRSSTKTSHRRIRWRATTTATGAMLVAFSAMGCGGGQLSQTATQDPAINGANAQLDYLQLRDIVLLAEPATEDGLPRYSDVRLAFVVVNTSDGRTDRLTSIESPAALSVTIHAPAGGLEIGPGEAIAASHPVENVENTAAPDAPFTVNMTLSDRAVRPGLPVSVTFGFARAGKVDVQVPFDVWAPGESLPESRPLPPTS